MGLDLENNAFSQKMINRKNLAFFLNFLNMAKMGRGAEMGRKPRKCVIYVRDIVQNAKNTIKQHLGVDRATLWCKVVFQKWGRKWGRLSSTMADTDCAIYSVCSTNWGEILTLCHVICPILRPWYPPPFPPPFYFASLFVKSICLWF